jgi:hypothetical protein
MFGTLVKIAVALVVAFVILRVGVSVLASLARGAPEPEPGDMRKVNIRYRCGVCGAELKMTLASEDLPTPPRHCQEEMDLVAPIE